MSHTQAARVLAAAEELELLEVCRRQDDSKLPRSRLSLLTSMGILAEANERSTTRSRPTSSLPRWAAFGHRLETAFAQLGAGRCLPALGRPDEAGGHLRGAREIFSRLGALPLSEQTDDLLARATAKSS